MSRTKALASILLVLFVAALAVWRSMPSSIRPVTPAPVAQPPKPPTGVKIAAVWRETIDEDLQAVGSLLADESIVLRPEIAGRIEAIRFSEGGRVAAGDLLFELNAAENRAMLAQTEAQQLLDRQNFERVKEMRQKNLTSAQQYDEVLAKLKYSNASVEKERIRLDKMVLRAPFAGVVGLRLVAIGDYVTEGQALVNLEALNPIKLDFKLPERYAAFLRVGLPLTVKVEAYPGRDFGGVVYAIDPRLDEATRTLKVRARLPNESLLLKPGMFATIRLGLKGTRDALFAPEQALMMKGSDAYVYRLTDAKAALTLVNIGMRRKGNVEITSGLKAGDRVVTDGQTKLRDGGAVTVIDGATGSP